MNYWTKFGLICACGGLSILLGLLILPSGREAILGLFAGPKNATVDTSNAKQAGILKQVQNDIASLMGEITGVKQDIKTNTQDIAQLKKSAPIPSTSSPPTQQDINSLKQAVTDLAARPQGTITGVATGLGLSGGGGSGSVTVAIVPGVGITVANGKVEATLGDSVDLTSEVLNVLPVTNGGTGLSTAPASGQILVGNGTGYDLVNISAGGGLVMTNAGGNLTFAVDTTVCRTSGNCAGSGGGIVGSGTQNYVPKFTGSGTLGNSLITDDGTTVGINNPSPNSTFALDVGGNINSSSYSIGGTSTLYTSGGNPVLHAAVGKYIAFAPNDAEAMRIDATGKVGIGTPSPQSKLDVAGGVTIGSYAGVNAAPSNGLIVSGNVGIGTSSTGRSLTVSMNNTNTATGQFLIEQAGTGNSWMNIGMAGGTYYAFGIDHADSDKLKIGYSTTNPSGPSNSTRLTIDTTGNVGIGTTTPGAKLEVGGTFKASGSVTLGNYTTNGGILYTNSSGAVSQLAAGSTGQCLQANTGAAASWGSCAAANTVTGTGASGQVGFWSGANTQTGSNNFFWNSTTNRLGLNTAASPGATLDVTSSETTANAAQIKANSLTTGKGLYISSTSTALTTGGLEGLDWSPTAATTMTGDLFSINVGPNGTVGNILNLTNDGLSVFSVSQSQITANVPVAFNAPGDFSIANDLQFTNSTAANIKSYGPLRIQSGDKFNSSDLTLGTYNSGVVMLDSLTVATADSTNVGIGVYSPSAALNIRAGVSTAGGAPIKLTAGTNLTAPEKGAIEYDGTYLYITDGSSSRQPIATSNNLLTITNKTVGTGGLAWAGGSAPGLSSAGSARQYFDSTSNTMKVSENGGAYADTLNAGRALQQPITTKTSAYSITATDGIVLMNTSGGSFAVTLPSAVGIAGKQYTIKELSNSNFGTVATTSSQTIDGVVGYTFSTQNETITVASDGANWQIIGKK